MDARIDTTIEIMSTLPVTRKQYRLFRKVGFTRHDANMLVCGMILADSGLGRLKFNEGSRGWERDAGTY